MGPSYNEKHEYLKTLSGGGGAGKSHLIKIIHQTAVKTFRHPPINPELPTVLLMAPTGVAAIKVDGTKINTALLFLKKQVIVFQQSQTERKHNYDYLYLILSL